MRLQQRSPNDLRRMRREHELDPQRSHGVGERVGRQAGGPPARERIGARTRLRATCPSRARNRGGGGPDDAARRCWRASESARTPARSARPPRSAARSGRSASSSKAVGSPACARFASARTSSTSSSSASPSKAAQRVAEQLAEPPHVVAQPLVRVIVHGRVSQGQRRSSTSGWCLRFRSPCQPRAFYRGAELAHHPDVGQNVIGDLRHPVVRGAVRKRDKQPRSSTTTGQHQPRKADGRRRRSLSSRRDSRSW